MRFSIIKVIMFLMVVGVIVSAGCGDKAVEPAEASQQEAVATERATSLTTQTQKASYAIGVDIAKGIKRQGVEIDVNIFAQGLRDELAGEKLLMTDEEMQAAMTALQTEIMQKQAEAITKAGEENKVKGEAFLAENKTKEGVKTTASGLQYKIIKEGTGKKPTLKDTVECHYQGTLIDGTEFDSSFKRGQPATFPVSGVIAGWTEALQMMPVGSKWQLFIPSDLAYGERGAGGAIGPNETLIFVVELLAIK